VSCAQFKTASVLLLLEEIDDPASLKKNASFHSIAKQKGNRRTLRSRFGEKGVAYTGGSERKKRCPCTDAGNER